MQFKRWRLVADRTLVNAGAASLLIFLAACGGASDDPGETGDGAPSTSGGGEAAGLDTISLPAVWSTTPLDGPVADVALAGGASSLMAVAYEGRGLELFNLEAERVADIARFAIEDLANGHFVEIDGAGLTVFPGLNREGEIKAYVYGDGLITPAEVDLPVAAQGRIHGICSTRATGEEGDVLRMGYWTQENPRQLQIGVISVNGGEFAWRDVLVSASETDIGACSLEGGAAFSEVGTGAHGALERPGIVARVTLSQAGELRAGREDQALRPLALRDGITVRAPVRPAAMAALGAPFGGGYPGGVIVVAGETGPDTYQAVFVDAGDLTSPSEE